MAVKPPVRIIPGIVKNAHRYAAQEGVGSGWGRNDTLSRCFLGPEIFAGQ